MQDLIEKLKAATEGSRKLDTQIEACRLGEDWYPSISEISGEWLCFSKSKFRDAAKKFPECRAAPAYTRSLDAARALVPSTLQWRVGADVENGAGWAVVGRADFDDFTETIADAATPEIALCIAAIEAGEQMK